MKKALKWILWILLGIVLLLIPKIFGIYYTNFFVMFAIMAVFSQSINIELGYTRILNFGHAMFFGMGGYGAALALRHIPGMPILGAVLLRLAGGGFIGPDFMPPWSSGSAAWPVPCCTWPLTRSSLCWP